MNRRDFLGAFAGSTVGLAALGAAAATLTGCGGGGGMGTNEPPLPPPFTPACAPTGGLPEALTTCRNWITFAPPRPFDPTRSVYPNESQLRDALTRLYREGWRGLVTYSLDGTLSTIPRIAKETGFTQVVAGLFWFDEAQRGRERAAALQQLAFIDGFVLGNEGLQEGRYTRARLETEITALRADTNRPVTTTEPLNQYVADPALLLVGDWAFPNIQPWGQTGAEIKSVPDAARFVQDQYRALQAAAPGRTVVIKEAWWPAGGSDPAATEANQTAFFQQLAAAPDVKFVFGEAYDQFWKATSARPYEAHFGLHTDRAAAKNAILALQSLYTGPY